MVVSISELPRRMLGAWKSSSSTSSVLPFVPKPLKWLVLFVLLINIRGLPLSWHVRVFRPAIFARIYHAIRNRLDTPQQRMARLTAIARVGEDPFLCETVFRTRATFDACDFNFHLSNSSYAMVFDMLRFKYVVENLPFVYPDGGWIALGATHFVFTREIPLNSKFEIRLSIATWDKKWAYTVARFVTYPKDPKSHSKSASLDSQIQATTLDLTPGGSIAPSPARSPTPVSVLANSSSLSALLLPQDTWVGAPLPAGAMLHCTAVSKLCFKFGRITVPPEIMMAANGHGLSPERFKAVTKLRFDNKDGLRELYKGGWKSAPREERWWEDAFGSGLMENKRAQGLRNLAETVGIPIVRD